MGQLVPLRSGCLVLARNPAAAYALSAYFRKKSDEAAAAAAAEAAALLNPEDGSARSLEAWGRERDDPDPRAAAAGIKLGVDTRFVSGGITAGSVERVYWALVSAKPAHGRATEGTVHAALAQFKRLRYGADGKYLNMKVSPRLARDEDEDKRGKNAKEGYRWTRARKRESRGEHVDFLDGVERMVAPLYKSNPLDP
jgi:hypothetical protein